MKALIAMSGGVDSSAAALLMKERGYECIGCTMKLYDNVDAGIDRSKTCCSLDDVEDARSVARLLGMPYYVFNFKDDFKEKVIDKFIHCYECGMTPNPCIDCNHYLKFDRLYRRSQELGCDYIVTGHYARVERCGDKWVLKKGLDGTKDQSYVLYHMNQELLSHLLLPLGDMRKSEIREMAEKHGFVNADKPDSQDICFVPDGDYARVIELHTGRTYAPGNFVTKDGKILGQHKGIIHYTIGQRRGLGIAADQPLYVCALDIQKNEVVLGHLEDLFSREVLVRDVNWISGEAPEGEVRCKVKTRYRQKEQPASVWAADGTWARIVFDEPQRAVTPGQSAVMYDGDVVLGGGTIVETFT
jgi:tRNA-uridine 2-sulfurtransferase